MVKLQHSPTGCDVFVQPENVIRVSPDYRTPLDNSRCLIVHAGGETTWVYGAARDVALRLARALNMEIAS
jgi:hypothetical protein